MAVAVVEIVAGLNLMSGSCDFGFDYDVVVVAGVAAADVELSCCSHASCLKVR